MQGFPMMVTIKQAADATNLSYNFIRQLCLDKKIVYVRAGNKYMINMDKFVNYLNGEIEN